jgi:hypothetical protein
MTILIKEFHIFMIFELNGNNEIIPRFQYTFVYKPIMCIIKAYIQ